MQLTNTYGKVEVITTWSFWHFWNMRKLVRRTRRRIMKAYDLDKQVDLKSKQLLEDTKKGDEKLTAEEFALIRKNTKRLFKYMQDVITVLLIHSKEEVAMLKKQLDRLLLPLKDDNFKSLLTVDNRNGLEKYFKHLDEFETAFEDKVINELTFGFKLYLGDQENYLKYKEMVYRRMNLYAAITQHMWDEANVIRDEKKINDDLIKALKEIVVLWKHYQKKKDNADKINTAVKNLINLLEKEFKALEIDITHLNNTLHMGIVLLLKQRDRNNQYEQFLSKIQEMGFDKKKAEELKTELDKYDKDVKMIVTHFLAMVKYVSELENQVKQEAKYGEKSLRSAA